MNDLDLCLEVVSRSRQPLCYIWRWISRKPLEIEVWFQRTTNRKWHMGYRMVTWPMTSPDPKMCCEAVRSAILATVWLLVLKQPLSVLQWGPDDSMSRGYDRRLGDIGSHRSRSTRCWHCEEGVHPRTGPQVLGPYQRHGGLCSTYCWEKYS